jgi:uncharacterized protein DUF4382
MTTSLRTPAALGALALAAALSAGCTDSVNLEAMGTAEVTFQRTGQSVTSLQSSGTGSGMVFTIPGDTVASLNVTVTAIQFLRAGADSNAWVSLDLSSPVTIDLMALPTSGSSPLVVASGSVQAGAYGSVRLFVTNPQVTFKGDVTLGTSLFQAGVAYDVTLPSGAQTGLKTDVSFTVEASANGGATADVPLLFDEGATLTNVAVTGTSTIMLAPVIRAGS